MKRVALLLLASWLLSAVAWAADPLAALAADPAPDPRWDRWQLLMWQDRTPAQMSGLVRLGFTGAKVRASGGMVDEAGRAQRQQAGLDYYLENLATDFYAAYHRYTPDKGVTWLFEDAKARRRANPADASVFMRQPGLTDPASLAAVRARLDRVVRAEAPHRPLFYNLGDESGIADLAAAWDFDQSPASLDGFRTWLHGQYASLDALNQEWGTAYSEWAAVQPMLTDAALQRTDGNFAAWSDFKAWMDVAFARAVEAGTGAVHAADRAALSALEGGQLPGWGGYDYTMLAPAVDVMEIYDFAEALDLALAFNPALIPLRTSFGTGPRETHAAWHSLLHGGRGAVVWDETDNVVGADGTQLRRGEELAALARAITPMAALLHQARPAPDPVAIFYSQASFRIRWLLDRRAGDHDWAARDAEREYDDNAWRASRRVLTQHLAEIGVQPRIVSGEMLHQGALRGVKVLFLPHAIALSDAEITDIQAFRAAGGTVLADTEPGLFDGHGRRRAAPPLPDVPHPQSVRPVGDPSSPESLAALALVLRDAGARPRAQLLDASGSELVSGLDVRWFRHPRGIVLAIMDGQPWSSQGVVTLRLPGPMVITDLRQGDTILGREARLSLSGIEPRLLLLETPP